MLRLFATPNTTPIFPSRGFELIEINNREFHSASRLGNRFFDDAGLTRPSRILEKFFATRAQRPYLTLRAVRVSRITSAPAVPDQPVTEVRPLLFRDQPHQVRFDFFRDTRFF